MDQSWGTRDQVIESVSVSRSMVLVHYARGTSWIRAGEPEIRW